MCSSPAEHRSFSKGSIEDNTQLCLHRKPKPTFFASVKNNNAMENYRPPKSRRLLNAKHSMIRRSEALAMSISTGHQVSTGEAEQSTASKQVPGTNLLRSISILKPEDDEETVFLFEMKDFNKKFRELSAELQLLIFECFFADRLATNVARSVFGVTPELVKGLRGHPVLYQEALKAWYDVTEVRVGKGRGPNSYCLKSLKPDVLRKLVKVLKLEHKVSSYYFSLCDIPTLTGIWHMAPEAHYTWTWEVMDKILSGPHGDWSKAQNDRSCSTSRVAPWIQGTLEIRTRLSNDCKALVDALQTAEVD